METAYKSINRLHKNTTPLCFLPSGRLVCYRKGSLLVLKDGTIENRYPVFNGRKERLLGGCKLLSRLLRTGVRAAIAVDENRVALSVDNMIYEYDFTERKLSSGYNCGQGIRPLTFTSVNNIDGFDDGLYFGAYIGRLTPMPVSIFRRTGVDRWEVVYTFEEGFINHIHNILPDSYRKCLWVMTGDFDEATAFWKATDNFKSVERVVCGNQKYRGCVGFVLKEGLLYAMDSPLTDNYIYMFNPDDLSCERVAPISGSCIYGCQWKDGYAFSSTVEPEGKYKNKLDFIFHWKIGPGIHDRNTRIYYGNSNEGFEVIHQEKKDLLPFIFQFGMIKFPKGWNDGDSLYFMPVSTRKNDMDLMRITFRK